MAAKDKPAEGIVDDGTNPPPALELEVADTAEAKLIAAFAAAQGEFPTIEKTQTATVPGKDGKQGYSYSYADLGDVLAKVRPVLSRHGLVLMQRVTTGERGLVLVTELAHVGGGKLEPAVLPLGRDTGAPQAFGGALTYLRRYAAVTYLNIAAEEDRDAQDVPVASGRQASADLPPWATMLGPDRIRTELGPRLRVLLGEEEAKTVYRLIRDSLGGVPAVVIPVVGAILDALVAGDEEELVGRLNGEATTRLERERAAQDAAAEAPDPPAQDDAEPASDAVRAAFANPEATAHIDAMAAEAREAGGNPPARELTDEEKAKLRASAEEAAKAAGPKPEQAPAGKTPHPDIAALDGTAAVAALRAAGCICDDPLEASANESARKTECPIKGHGIPF